MCAITCALATACSKATPPPESAATPAVLGSDTCGEATAVSLNDDTPTSVAFRQLRGLHRAPLAFACPTEQPCGLPKDTQIEFSLEPTRPVACEFAACRVPYLGSLPFADDPSDPCPKVLWSVFRVTLKSDGTTLDELATDVNVLASPKGEAYLRFTIENPTPLARSLRQLTPDAAPRTSMLDVQLEVADGKLRGQLSALSAPLPAPPVTDLRFTGLWSARWELEERK